MRPTFISVLCIVAVATVTATAIWTATAGRHFSFEDYLFASKIIWVAAIFFAVNLYVARRGS